MNDPDHNQNDDAESREEDLVAEFEQLVIQMRRCLFVYNKVQRLEFNRLMQDNKQLIEYGLLFFRKIPFDFVKQNAHEILQTDPPDVLAGRLAMILNLYTYRLQENLSNRHYFEMMLFMMDVLVKFRRR